MRIINQDKTMDINYDNFTIYVDDLGPGSDYYIYATPDYSERNVLLELAGPMSYEDAKNLLKRIRDAYSVGDKYIEL